MPLKRFNIIILAAGLLIRLAALALQPAFCDEAFIYFASKSESLLRILAHDPHPPLWNYLMRLPIALTANIALLRLPALLFSMLAINASFTLGCRVKDEKAGLAMAGFTALCYPVWLAEIQLRPNAILTWLTLILVIMMLEIRQEGRPRKGWLLFTAAAACCASIHYLGAVIAVFFLAASFFTASRKKAAACLAAALVPISAWLLLTHDSQASNTTLVTSNHLRALSAPASLFGLETAIDIVADDPANEKAGGLNQDNAIWRLAFSSPLWLLLFTGIASIAKQDKFQAIILAGTFTFPAAVLIAGSLLGKGIYQNRYLLFVSVPLALLIYAGGDSLKGSLRKISSVLFCTIAGANILICLAFPFTPSLWNQYWQSTISFIESNHSPGDKICIFIPYSTMTFAMDYDPGSISVIFTADGNYDIISAPSAGKLKLIPLDDGMAEDARFLDYLAQGNVFLILCQEEMRGNGRIMAALDERFTPVLHFRSKSYVYWSDAECYLLTPKNNRTQP